MKGFDEWFVDAVEGMIPESHREAHPLKTMKEHMRKGWRACAEYKDKVLEGMQKDLDECIVKIEAFDKEKEELNFNIHYLTNKVKELEKSLKKK